MVSRSDDKAVLHMLPPRRVFPRAMPRYPNLWFLVSRELALRGENVHALRLLAELLEQRIGLRDSFVSGVENPNLLTYLGTPGEGSDFQARMGPFQPYDDPTDSSRSHLHQVHARFYLSPFPRERGCRIALRGERGSEEFFAFAASVHYEVATEEPSHPYVDSCPLCGITGAYAMPISRAGQDYCLKIHDPLGLEAILYGRVRGSEILGARGARIPCVADLEGQFDCRIGDHRSDLPFHATRLAIVTLRPRR